MHEMGGNLNKAGVPFDGFAGGATFALHGRLRLNCLGVPSPLAWGTYQNPILSYRISADSRLRMKLLLFLSLTDAWIQWIKIGLISGQFSSTSTWCASCFMVTVVTQSNYPEHSHIPICSRQILTPMQMNFRVVTSLLQVLNMTSTLGFASDFLWSYFISPVLEVSIFYFICYIYFLFYFCCFL